MVHIGNDWDIVLGEEFGKDYYLKLREFLKAEYFSRKIYPPMNDIFNALKYTSYEDARVVILGQDPYHGEGQAHGLCFSVKCGTPLPPSLKNIFKYLPRAYENGQVDVEAREKMANAATMAGMAFANAFLGICHSMAHKLGAFHHLPHGVANALMIEEVIRFNASETPTKMGTFSQYDHPHTLARYAEIADSLGLGGNTDEEKLENLIAAINNLKSSVGIKDCIKDYGIDENDFLKTLDEMVEHAFDDQCTGANPRYPLMSEIKQMYLNAYYGKSYAKKV